jgi:class 3 adenylate cyclase
MKPETRYARSGNVNIAYQVVGEGSLDLVLVHGWVNHLDLMWDEPGGARALERLASFARLILFDKRGTGLSDRVADAALPTLEQRMDDVRAVMDSVGSRRAALFGISEGGPMCALFAATYPARTHSLVMYGSYAKWIREPEYPWAMTREEHERAFAAFEKHWGTPVGLQRIAPSVAADERYRNWFARLLRVGASPGAALALYRMNIEIDIRHVLPSIRVPTLVVQREGDRLIDLGNSRYLAAHIPAAKLVVLDGIDHAPWVGDANALIGEVEEFLTGARHETEADRVLATVMFTDIVGSTQLAASLGDRHWGDLLESYLACARTEITRFRGREIDTAGDGFFAAFDGPARGVRCAMAIRAATRSLGLTMRAGLHAGECQTIGDKIGGIAVHMGSRIASLAGSGEIMVSSTVKDLVAGSGLRFRERGSHELKGVPGQWQLYSVESG